VIRSTGTPGAVFSQRRGGGVCTSRSLADRSVPSLATAAGQERPFSHHSCIVVSARRGSSQLRRPMPVYISRRWPSASVRALRQECCRLFLLLTTSSPGEEGPPPGCAENDRSCGTSEKWPQWDGRWRRDWWGRHVEAEAEAEQDWLMLGVHASKDQGVTAKRES